MDERERREPSEIIDTLPPEMIEALCWLMEHMDRLDQITEGEALTERPSGAFRKR